MNNHDCMPDPEFFRQRAILTARNEDVRTLNTTILARLPGLEQTYDSADSYFIESPSEHQNPNVPVEFLHSLNASGLPIAHLSLKLGCPIIILRNIDAKRGLCNGSRATILRMSHRVLEIRLIGGDHNGETALIPRITLSPSLTDLDFAIKLNRRQFPIQVALAMTIHRSQGQTLDQIGIDLRYPVFAHGQLYVAFSRATTSQHIKVLLPENSRMSNTPNVVWNEILLD
jgi:ATP-dependent exoDNAse (exonuclease V) alpha subunit